MSENFTSPIIVHGEGLAQLTRTELEERLCVLGLQVAVPILPQHGETVQGIIELHQEQSRLPVVFDESEFRAFASRDFTTTATTKTWHEISRLGICFPLTPNAIVNGRSLEDNVAFFYPHSLLAPDAVASHEQGFALSVGHVTHPELWKESNPDAVSAQKIVNNGTFQARVNIGERCVALLRQFCDHSLGVSGG